MSDVIPVHFNASYLYRFGVFLSDIVYYMSEIQEVERLLAENDNNSLSSLSCSVSFTTDDILMEPDG